MKRKVRQLFLVLGADLALLCLLFYTAMGAAWGTAALQSDAPAAGEEPGGVVALTFDDGPSRECTGRLLDGLSERGVKATFFLMGENVEGNEDLVLRMKEEGHLIGNHGYSHEQMTKGGIAQVRRSVEETGRIIGEITGKAPDYLRPPYGDWNEDLAESLDLTPVFWSVDSLDWQTQDAARTARRVVKEAGNGDVILMHDIFPSSVDAALEIVDTLLSRGYTFVTADEMIID